MTTRRPSLASALLALLVLGSTGCDPGGSTPDIDSGSGGGTDAPIPPGTDTGPAVDAAGPGG